MGKNDMECERKGREGGTERGSEGEKKRGCEGMEVTVKEASRGCE